MQLTHLTSARHLGIPAALIAVALWSSAPLLAEQARSVSPLMLTTLTLFAGALSTLPLSRRTSTAHLNLGWCLIIWLGMPLIILGAVGSYFIGMRIAPAAEAALITYTWPVLFVLLSQWTRLGRIRLKSLTGALIAFSGAALLLAPQADASAPLASLPGYGFALLAALCWALYSWLGQAAPTSLTPQLPRLLLTATLMSGTATLWFEGGITLPNQTALAAGTALGLGPFGIAMVAWDKALRHGRASVVGSLAYGVPLLAAALLVIAGISPLDWRLPLAAMLVIAGCVQASR
ncbi:DMT family transporter [Halomonas llamarensis]|uniref:DMT family transporter n=1 Tax=Halomonas llamarensis TaxID=2945104 RepID=A0ABT0SP62_9GAMM|nr:DMT family transporter [Halomonas llamarensis]MCL7929624.1 DMT family transporter [Halomonas llamarensis]